MENIATVGALHNIFKDKKFWEELIHLLSLRKSFIWNTWT
jgi:hypothetical protein